MGNFIEVNDTLQITVEQGFPLATFNLQDHIEKPVTLDDIKGKIFTFQEKPRARIFHLEPVRVFFVQNIDGKWLFWGHAQIQEQSISKSIDRSGNWNGEWQTSGRFILSKVYSPDIQRTITIHESPPGKSYFGDG